jgi:hypothetical protein
MPNAAYVKPELVAKTRVYELIADAVDGEVAVKGRKTKYLPMPNPADTSTENQKRYQSYIDRAVFYNVSRRTLAGLVGEVFDTPPAAKLPTSLDPIVKDASGGGISLEQLAKRATRLALANGRAGILTDFPQAPPEGFTQAQIASGLVRSTLTVYAPLDIINWRVEEVDGVDQLILVVLKEKYVISDDGFQEKTGIQYRALRLIGGKYVVEIYRDKFTGPFQTLNPTDKNGNPLEAIPFQFIGSENNDADIDEAPMYDLCSLNIAHYRNSADFEEACFIVGQPTPWFAGLTESWVDDVLGGQISLGARAAIPLPVGGTAGLLQVQETTMAFDAMGHKEAQMVALGAKLITAPEAAVTATEAKIDNRSETSVLATVAGNVTSAIEKALQVALLFQTGEKDTTLEYKLNTQYALAALTSDELNAVVLAWQNASISWTEMRTRLRYAGIATEDDTTAKTEIEGDQAKADARAIDTANKTAEGSALKLKPSFPKPVAKAA